MNQKQVFNLIKSASGQAKILTVPRLILDMLDSDFPSALMLSQLIYWSDKGKHNDGYIYKSDIEWQEEIGISRKQAGRARKKLVELGLIETVVKRANGAPTVHYKLIEDKLVQWIVPKGAMDCPERAQSLTEITTEITTEKELPKREPTDNWIIADALGKLTGMDINLKSNKGRLLRASKQLIEADYSAADILEFRTWWYKDYWLGKKGQVPTLAQVITHIGRGWRPEPIIPPTYDGDLVLLATPADGVDIPHEFVYTEVEEDI